MVRNPLPRPPTLPQQKAAGEQGWVLVPCGPCWLVSSSPEVVAPSRGCASGFQELFLPLTVQDGGQEEEDPVFSGSLKASGEALAFKGVTVHQGRGAGSAGREAGRLLRSRDIGLCLD